MNIQIYFQNTINFYAFLFIIMMPGKMKYERYLIKQLRVKSL